MMEPDLCSKNHRFGLTHEPQQITDGVGGFDGMSQRQLIVHRVVISASILDDGEKTALGELGNNALHRPFGDAYRLRQVAYPQIRGARQADQHMGVVREEGPGGGRRLRC